MQPVYKPVIRILSSCKAHYLPIQCHLLGRPTARCHGDQVETPTINGIGKVHLTVLIVGVEEILPVSKRRRSKERERES